MDSITVVFVDVAVLQMMHTHAHDVSLQVETS